MNDILCQKCGHSINSHDTGGCVNVENWYYTCAGCNLTPQDIAAHTVEQAKKDAVFMANVWKLCGTEFSGIVDQLGGDSNGVDFVANRILGQEQP